MSGVMRASYVLEPGRIAVGEFAVRAPQRDGDVLVRMARASICGSDVQSVFHGFLKPQGVGRPGSPGHEGVGTVVETRSSLFDAGDAVLTVPSVGGCFAQFQLVDAGIWYGFRPVPTFLDCSWRSSTERRCSPCGCSGPAARPVRPR